MPSFQVLNNLDEPQRSTDALLAPSNLSPDSTAGQTQATAAPASPASTAIQAVGNAAGSNGQPTAAASTPTASQQTGAMAQAPAAPKSGFQAVFDANKNVDVQGQATQTAISNANNIQALQTSAANAYQPTAIDNSAAVNSYVTNGGSIPSLTNQVTQYSPNTSDSYQFSVLNNLGQQAAANPLQGLNSFDAAIASQNPNLTSDAQNQIGKSEQAITDATSAANDRYGQAQQASDANSGAVTQSLTKQQGALQSQADAAYKVQQTAAAQAAYTAEQQKIMQDETAVQNNSALNDPTKANQLAQFQGLYQSLNPQNVTFVPGNSLSALSSPDIAKFNRIDQLLGQSGYGGSTAAPVANYGDPAVTAAEDKINQTFIQPTTFGPGWEHGLQPDPNQPGMLTPGAIPALATTGRPGGMVEPFSNSTPTNTSALANLTQQKYDAIKTMSIPQLATLYAQSLNLNDTTDTAALDNAMLQLNVHAADLMAFPEFKAAYKGPPSQQTPAPAAAAPAIPNFTVLNTPIAPIIQGSDSGNQAAQTQAVYNNIKTQNVQQLATTYANSLNVDNTQATAALDAALLQLNVHPEDLVAFPEFKAAYKGTKSQQ